MARTKGHGSIEGGSRSVDPAESPLGAVDLHLFNEGTHERLYEKLGSHPLALGGVDGTHFAVWAPDAASVSVIGDFNGWDNKRHPLFPRERSGIWEGFLSGIGHGTLYKYHIVSRYHGHKMDKTDPYARFCEVPPRTAGIVWDISYDWHDDEWMKGRGRRQTLQSPISVYELHLGSWQRKIEAGGRSLTYRELAEPLANHVKKLGFTHVEFMPVMEHPFYGSWGYQTTGYFAPSARFGTPQDFMFLIDYLHQQGLGVILDWVPSHFPGDDHGLAFFDGTHLFEHAYKEKGFHPDWKSWIFNYGRHEVVAFLISSAVFWLDKYHADGLRVDAVASMLYLDYSRRAGEWMPNQHGGRENLEAIRFLRQFNESVYRNFPDVQTYAEESTAWPSVSRPTYLGGLGFGMKWDMGWMHDTLKYFEKNPVHRKFHHNELTFRMVYAFTENFVLPLSHDEVTHGKGSLLSKMPGDDDWQKFANLRLLYGYTYSQPGKKLLFMGAEIGQWSEWGHDASLDWHLMEFAPHQGIERWLGDLNRLYAAQPALHELDCDYRGFTWIDCNDSASSILAFTRHGTGGRGPILIVANFTPVPRTSYRIGVSESGPWRELLNSDAEVYGGSGMGNLGVVEAQPEPSHDRPFSLVLTLPPLAVVFFTPAK